jgi:hypothetical protein
MNILQIIKDNFISNENSFVISIELQEARAKNSGRALLIVGAFSRRGV